MAGDVIDIGNAAQRPSMCFLSLLTAARHGSRSTGDVAAEQAGRLASMVTDSLSFVLEMPRDGLTLIPDRTKNRIRSPRFAASGPLSKVGKGSRQDRSVTSGKGLALSAGRGIPPAVSPK